MATSIGSNLAQLRKKRGISAASLADQAGLDPTAISKIENGTRGLKSADILALSRALAVSPTVILEPDSLPARLTVAARSEQTEGTEFAAERLSQLAEVHHLLGESGIPAEPCPTPRRSVPSLRGARDLAGEMRELFQKPPDGEHRFDWLAQVIEDQLRVPVIVESLGSEVMGATITDAEFPLILINADQPRPRALFTLAHELGHVLFGGGEPISVESRLSVTGPAERAANAFASDLLVPEESVADLKSSGSTDAVIRLLLDLDVSYQTLIYRLHNLGLVDAAGRDERLRLSMAGLAASAEDTEAGERLLARLSEKPNPRPSHALLRRMVAGYRQGVISAQPIADLLGAPVDAVIEALSPSDTSPVPVVQDSPRIEAEDARYAGSPV